MQTRTLLAQPRLSLITRHADGELTRIQDIIEHKVLVDGRADIEVLFGSLLAAGSPGVPKTLDLIGHSTPGQSLLMLGDWVIDAASPTVKAFFRELADQEVLRRLGITAVRLLGCRTANTGAARTTLLALSEILEVEVFGTRNLIYSAHYDRTGFADHRRYVLIGSRELAADEYGSTPTTMTDPYPQNLDVDMLPASASATPSGSWTHRHATEQEMREVLRHVRRRDGAQMPGLLASPLCEILFPGDEPTTFRRAQVVLGGEFVRFYPRGESEPGVVFAVEDSHALVKLVDRLPASSASGRGSRFDAANAD